MDKANKQDQVLLDLLRLAPESLREVALTPAWQHFFLWIKQLIEQARYELEGAENREEFLEIRGVLKAFRRIDGWKEEMMEQITELKKRGSYDGNGD
jgi:hypothetical protein